MEQYEHTSFTEPFNQPIEYGRYIARLANMLTGGGIMVQRLGDLLQGRRTDWSRLEKSSTVPTMKGAVPGDLSYVLPARYLTSIVEALKAVSYTHLLRDSCPGAELAEGRRFAGQTPQAELKAWADKF